MWKCLSEADKWDRTSRKWALLGKCRPKWIALGHLPEHNRAMLRQLNPTHSMCLTSIGVCMFRCLAIKSTILFLWKQFENKKAKGISETQRTQKRYTEMKGGNKHMKNMNLSVESWVIKTGILRQAVLPARLSFAAIHSWDCHSCLHSLSISPCKAEEHLSTAQW